MKCKNASGRLAGTTGPLGGPFRRQAFPVSLKSKRGVRGYDPCMHKITENDRIFAS